jgi:hypothetical protein
MISDPMAAQVALQYAVNMYNDEERKNSDKALTPYLSGALQNLAAFRKEFIKRSSEEPL